MTDDKPTKDKDKPGTPGATDPIKRPSTTDAPIKEKAKPEPENIHRKALNVLVQNLGDKHFCSTNTIPFDTAQKILMYIETLLHHGGIHIDGARSADGYTMSPCPKHGVAPIHWCMVGHMTDVKDKSGRTKKGRAGKCRYFDGQDIQHGICKAPKGVREIGGETLTHEEAFMKESKYRQRPKEMLSDLSSVSESAKAAQEAKKLAGKKGVRKTTGGKKETDYLPGNPTPFNG